MMPRPRRFLALRLALVIGASCARGFAAPDPPFRVQLEYNAEPDLGCPNAAELSADIARQLGYDPFATEGTEQRLRITITKPAERAEAKLEWLHQAAQPEGERRLTGEGPSCHDLARSLVFVAAVQIQLHASAAAPPDGLQPKTILPQPAPSPKPPPAVIRETAAERFVTVGLGGMMRHGLSPSITPGARVFGVLSRPPWGLELSAHATLAAELRRADGTGFTTRELGVNLAPCIQSLPVGLCAVGTFSLLHVRGVGVDRVGSASSASGGVGARLQLAWRPLQRLGITVQGEVLALLASREVVLNRERVWSTSPVAFTAIVDFSTIFR
jgi:hypothetical protein